MDIVVASGKGGTGKTTVSVNLASFLSGTKSVILSDLDVEEPNSSLFVEGNLIKEQECYKMVPKWVEKDCTFCGECAKNCNFNAIIALPSEILVFPELCHSCYACSELCPTNSLPMRKEKIGMIRTYKNDHFDFIEGRLDLGQEMAVPLIAQTIEYAKTISTDIKIYDAPPGTSCPVIEATKDSDFVLLVTEPTPFGLNDLKLAVETMRVLRKDFGVIINRFGIGDDSIEKYCQEEKIDIVAKFLNDKEVAKLYSSGKIIYPKIKHFKESLRDIVLYLKKRGIL